MDITFITDTHLRGVDPVTSPEIEAILLADSVPSDVILGGDIVDVKNAKDVEEAMCLRDRITKHFGEQYLWGNHEMGFSKLRGLLREHVFITHGDFELYGEEKALKRRTAEPGCGVFMRSLKWIGSKFWGVFGWSSLGEKDKIALSRKAFQSGAKVILIGHVHPKKMIDIVYDGIRIIVAPRGINRLKNL
jgi:predicted phosphodiesterase